MPSSASCRTSFQRSRPTLHRLVVNLPANAPVQVNTSALTEDNKAALNDIAERVSEQREILDREVADLQKRFPNQSQLAVV